MNFFETKANTNIQNCAGQKCNNYENLGVFLDSNLTFEAHVESICLKLKKWIRIVLSLRKTCIRNTILMFYKTTVVPIFEFGLLIYGGTTLNKLQKLNGYKRKF